MDYFEYSKQYQTIKRITKLYKNKIYSMQNELQEYLLCYLYGCVLATNTAQTNDKISHFLLINFKWVVVKWVSKVGCIGKCLQKTYQLFFFFIGYCKTINKLVFIRV